MFVFSVAKATLEIALSVLSLISLLVTLYFQSTFATFKTFLLVGCTFRID